MKRQNISSDARWEDLVGYSRAVKIGNTIEVAGTTSIQDGLVLHVGDHYGQTKFILNKIKDVLESADSSMEHVVRTRIYVTDISFWQSVGKAHGEFFKDIRPASTMIEVSNLILPEILVEIEVKAIII
ncbi:MAG: RidA family protein [Bacteroidetes bacterium]|nr:RidA family protein [Bacteroidota bacterium]